MRNSVIVFLFDERFLCRLFSPELQALLLRDEVDLVVDCRPHHHPSLTSTPLFREKYAVVASEGFLAEHPIESPADLAGKDTHLEVVVFRGNKLRFAREEGRASMTIAEVMVSMANRADGVILFGVRDDGEIIGIESDKRELVETTRAP